MRVALSQRAAAMAIVVAPLLTACPLLAGAPPPVVPVQYAAPAPCPSVGAFLGEIRQRTQRVNVREASGVPGSFVVQIREYDKGFEGSLRSMTAAGTLTDRVLASVSCGDVASAFALVIALALDPDAMTSPLPAAAASDSSAAPPVPAAPPSSQPPPAPAYPAHLSAPPQPLRRPPAAATNTTWWIGAHAMFDPGMVASGITPGGAVTVQYTVDRGLGGLDPSIRVGAFYAGKTQQGEVGDARIRWGGARLDACLFFLHLSDWFDLAPCGGGAVGALHAEGVIASPKRTTSWWVDGSLSLRARVLAADSLSFDFDGGMLVPAWRYRYAFSDPDRQFHQVPAVAPRLWVGVSWRIP